MGPPMFWYCWIFGNFNASSENFQTLAVNTDKAFKFYLKIIELGPLSLKLPHCSWEGYILSSPLELLSCIGQWFSTMVLWEDQWWKKYIFLAKECFMKFHRELPHVIFLWSSPHTPFSYTIPVKNDYSGTCCFIHLCNL